MSTPTFPRVIWTGVVDSQTLRVVDRGAGHSERLVVELRAQADSMGGHGWSRFDPIPRAAFEQMLISSGVVQ